MIKLGLTFEGLDFPGWYDAFMQENQESITSLLSNGQCNDGGPGSIETFLDGYVPQGSSLADGHLANLEELFLHDNQITDDGATALAGALLEGRLEALEQLRLEGNRIGDAGAGAIARALRDGATKGASSSLKKLVIGDNAFGESAAAELREACEARGVAAHRGPFDLL